MDKAKLDRLHEAVLGIVQNQQGNAVQPDGNAIASRFRESGHEHELKVFVDSLRSVIQQ